MNIYKKMYYILFHAMTDAIYDIEQQNFGLAKQRLIEGQQRAEEAFLGSDELERMFEGDED